MFTALQGSQNYKLDDEMSDIDTKTLVVPFLRNLLFDKKRMSTTLEVAPTIEHADVKDVREMFNCFKKQNINFVEILFTKYVHVNHTFMPVYRELVQRKEDIAHYNRYQALKAMCGNMMEKYYAFDHPYPSAMDKINQYGYDPKQLHHLLRFKDFLIRYFKDEPYSECLVPQDREYLLAVKRGLLPLNDAQQLREETKAWMEKFLEEKSKTIPNECNQELDTWMDDLLYSSFARFYEFDRFLL